jgi:hypothetical protein
MNTVENKNPAFYWHTYMVLPLQTSPTCSINLANSVEQGFLRVTQLVPLPPKKRITLLWNRKVQCRFHKRPLESDWNQLHPTTLIMGQSINSRYGHFDCSLNLNVEDSEAHAALYSVSAVIHIDSIKGRQCSDHMSNLPPTAKQLTLLVWH